MTVSSYPPAKPIKRKGRTGGRWRMLSVARSQIGYQEGPNNATVYGDHTGYPNQPWCASFVMWCGDKAGVELPGASAYVPAWMEQLKARNHWRHGLWRARRGDLIFFDFAPGTGPAQHIGLVTSVRAWQFLGFVTTVEGNTWSGVGTYQGEGSGVYRRTRYRPDILGFGRVNYRKG